MSVLINIYIHMRIFMFINTHYINAGCITLYFVSMFFIRCANFTWSIENSYIRIHDETHIAKITTHLKYLLEIYQ